MGKLNDYKIAFMGQTGRGKSTLMNALFDTKFEIDSVKECTTWINSSTFYNRDTAIPYEAYTIMDTPGIGASTDKDEWYEPYYLHVLDTADCIVWVTNMLRRDRLDQEFFVKYKESLRSEIRYIICVNQIDILSPYKMKEGEHVWDFDRNCPTPILEELLKMRISLVEERLAKYLPVKCTIVPVSGFYKYGLEELKRQIFAQ